MTIQDDDGPGEISFTVEESQVVESRGEAILLVRRMRGSTGVVSCAWRTRDVTAMSPAGYTAGSGVLTFNGGVTRQTVRVPVVDTSAYERHESFEVVLSEAKGAFFANSKHLGDNQRMSRRMDGGEIVKELVAEVVITGDEVRFSLSRAQLCPMHLVRGGEDEVGRMAQSPEPCG